MPRISPKLLDKNYSQIATNCYFSHGRLEPSKAPLNTSTALLSNAQSIYWFNRESNSGKGYWFQWNSDVDVVRGPIVDDTNLRTYYTGDGVPKITTASLGQTGAGPYPGAARDLGLPAPDAITAAGPEGEPEEGTQTIATAYVITYVSEFGEEGPPSRASNIVDRWDGGAVRLTAIPVPSGNFLVTTKRIYRIELNGVYQFVAEIPVTAITYSDSIDSEFLGEPVPSEKWLAPHAEMIGLTALPNGVLMGWWDNTIAFSEAYQPHAWPPEYRLALDYDVVGAAVSAYGVVVTTTGAPYLIAGASPAAMSQNKMDVIQAGVSKRSVVDMGDYVVYASADGLVAAGGTDAQVITQPHITPEQWRVMFKPNSIHAYRWDDRYLGFYDTGSTRGSFSFNPEEGFRLFSDYADCAFLDDQSGDLYIKQGSLLKKWDQGENLSYVWKSKIFSVPPGQVFGCCKVDADSYPVTASFYSDGALTKTISVSSDKPFRLPTLTRYREAEIRITGTAIINSVQLANSMSEIL